MATVERKEITMHVLGMTLAGKIPSGGMPPSRFANVSRKVGNPYIKVSLISPTGERNHFVQADCAEDILSMAECLQEFLDGEKGTNSMVQDYYRILQHFAD